MEESRVLIVEDDLTVYSHIEEVINEVKKAVGFGIQIKHFKTLRDLEVEKEQLGDNYDLMILDLRLDHENGGNSTETLDQLNQISNKQFIPVVIYTGFANDVEEQYIKKWKLIKVIEKGSDLNGNLEKSIEKLLRTKFNFKSLFKRIEREFKVLSVDLLDEIFEGEPQIDEESVQALMISRLSALLTNRLNSIFDSRTRIPAEVKIVYPPLDNDKEIPISMGDILRDKSGDNWFLASPTCDLVNSDERNPKVKDVLLLRCFKSPEDVYNYIGDRKIKLSERREVSIVFKVPRAVSETGLLLIYSKLYKTQPYEDVLTWTKQLSITSLYADDAKAVFISDLLRLGVPDTSPDHDDLVKSFKHPSKP